MWVVCKGPVEQSEERGEGWRCEIHPPSSLVLQYHSISNTNTSGYKYLIALEFLFDKKFETYKTENS